MKSQNSNHYSLGQGLTIVLFYTLLISGSGLLIWLYFLQVKNQRGQDPQYRLEAIVQSSSKDLFLNTSYLAQWLDLSIDRPANLYRYQITEGEKKLMNTSLFKHVSIKKVRPGILFIQHEMREPVAYIGSHNNLAIDSEGYLFPFKPFFTPKNLPKLYLGIDNDQISWGSFIGGHERTRLAFHVLQKMDGKWSDHSFRVGTVDVSEAFAESEGQRQIIVILERNFRSGVGSFSQNLCIRFNVDHLDEGISDLLVLYQSLVEKGFPAERYLVIDLRIPQLAFIRK